MNRRSTAVVILLTSAVALSACDNKKRYATVQQCIAAGHQMEECRDGGQTGGHSSVIFIPRAGGYFGNTYYPPVAGYVGPPAAVSEPSGVSGTARGGFGSGGAAHPSAVGVGE